MFQSNFRVVESTPSGSPVINVLNTTISFSRLFLTVSVIPVPFELYSRRSYDLISMPSKLVSFLQFISSTFLRGTFPLPNDRDLLHESVTYGGGRPAQRTLPARLRGAILRHDSLAFVPIVCFIVDLHLLDNQPQQVVLALEIARDVLQP